MQIPRFSYSRVDCFKQCPMKYKFRYLDKLKTIPNQEAGNALYLGLGLHKGIETTVEEGITEYQSHYYVLTDEIVNWSIQLEYQIPKVKGLLPDGGQHEVEISHGDFIGFIDYVCGDTLYDFKFSNATDRYANSPQLPVYKYYYELTHPDHKINHLKYVMIPKLGIRQKRTETILQFRKRLLDELEKTQINVMEVTYDKRSITDFLNKRKLMETATNYPKNETRLCDYCEYEPWCKRGEKWILL